MSVNGQLCVFSSVLLFLPLVCIFLCQNTASTSRYQNESENDQSHQRLNTYCRLYYFVKLGVPTLIGQIPRHRNDRSYYYYFNLMFPDCSDQVLFFELVRIAKIPFSPLLLPLSHFRCDALVNRFQTVSVILVDFHFERLTP